MALRPQTWVFAAISLLGCGQGPGGDEPAAEADAGSLEGGTPDAAGPEPGVSPEAGAASDPPVVPILRPQTNVDFDSAQRVEPGDAPWLQDERSVDQVDYYVFSGAAGQFFELTTDRGTFTPDNVLSLYDAQHQLIAQNDDGGAGAGAKVDARLVVRLPADGDYYATVEDPFTPQTFFGSAFPLLFYHFALRELTEDTEGVSIARDDAPVKVRFVEDAATGFSHALLLGELDVDELTFDLAGATHQALIGTVLPSGPTGNGSTLEGGELRVVDDDQRVLAHIDRALGQRDFHPPLDEASYHVLLGVVDAPGDNAFHVLDLVLLPDNPAEQAEDTNGEQSEAEPIELTGGTWRRGLLLLQLPPDDEDYFVLDGHADESITVVCEGESGGSGVRGLHAELLDADGVLGSAVEASAANLSIPTTAIPQTGPLYLHVWTDVASADVEPWARCAVDTGP